MNDQTPKNEKRREFLRTSAAAGAGAAVVAVVPGVSVASDEPTDKPEVKENYRMTQHIADYYKSTN